MARQTPEIESVLKHFPGADILDVISRAPGSSTEGRVVEVDFQSGQKKREQTG